MTLSQRWLRGASAACALLAAVSCREEAGPVRLGVALSLTEPGVAPMVLGARLARRPEIAGALPAVLAAEFGALGREQVVQR